MEARQQIAAAEQRQRGDDTCQSTVQPVRTGQLFAPECHGQVDSQARYGGVAQRRFDLLCVAARKRLKQSSEALGLGAETILPG